MYCNHPHPFLPPLPSSLQGLDCNNCLLLPQGLKLEKQRLLQRIAYHCKIRWLQRFYRRKRRQQRAARKELNVLVLCVRTLSLDLPQDIRGVVFSCLVLCVRSLGVNLPRDIRGIVFSYLSKLAYMLRLAAGLNKG